MAHAQCTRIRACDYLISYRYLPPTYSSACSASSASSTVLLLTTIQTSPSPPLPLSSHLLLLIVNDDDGCPTGFCLFAFFLLFSLGFNTQLDTYHPAGHAAWQAGGLVLFCCVTSNFKSSWAVTIAATIGITALPVGFCLWLNQPGETLFITCFFFKFLLWKANVQDDFQDTWGWVVAAFSKLNRDLFHTNSMSCLLWNNAHAHGIYVYHAWYAIKYFIVYRYLHPIPSLRALPPLSPPSSPFPLSPPPPLPSCLLNDSPTDNNPSLPLSPPPFPSSVKAIAN